MKKFEEKPLSMVILRRFEKPSGDFEEDLRKFCISIGLLQPGDSRDIIVDILKVLLKKRKVRQLVSSEEISKMINKKGNSPVNIRRQIRRLIEIGIAERINGKYRITEFLKLEEILDRIKKFMIEPTIERINEYAKEIDSYTLE